MGNSLIISVMSHNILTFKCHKAQNVNVTGMKYKAKLN